MSNFSPLTVSCSRVNINISRGKKCKFFDVMLNELCRLILISSRHFLQSLIRKTKMLAPFKDIIFQFM